MLDQAKAPGAPPASPAAQDGEAPVPGRLLPDSEKLPHVPVFALHRLLAERAPAEPRPVAPLDEATERLAISVADIDELYENYRYGAKLSFYLYLLPEGLAEPDHAQLQRALDELSAAGSPDLVGEQQATDDYEAEAATDQILLLDEERLDGIREIRFRYYVVHRFLNADEHADQVFQTRYGFLWLDLKTAYLVILTRDEWLNGLWIRALSGCLQAMPLPVRFPKELVDKHFSIEKAKRISHYDPSTGIRQSISGQGLWKNAEQELRAREQRYVRPSSYYEEEIAAGVTSLLGVTANKGKIYLTRALPTSLVRAWGRQRLPELVRDLRDLRAAQPGAFQRSTEAIQRMRLPAAGKAALVAIVEALLKAERDDLTGVEMQQTALDTYDALAGKYFAPYLRAQCSQCEETAELCPHCDSQEIGFDQHRARCKACGMTIADGDSVALRCMNGHTTHAALAEAFSIAPNHWLQKRMIQILAELGQPWDEKADYFHVEDGTLYRLRKGESEIEQLPALVQTYVSNFWEPIAGQVHTGGGDLVVTDPAPGRGADGLDPDRQPSGTWGGGAPRTYRNFDLRLRPNGALGYTVEAAVEGGGSVPPQALLLPADGDWQRRLAAVLHQTTDAEGVRRTGEILYRALFPPRIARLWAGAVGGLADDAGLRIRLHIDVPELMALPWELIFDDEYIGLHLRFPIVRTLDLPTPPRPLGVEPPLRVLVAAAQPQDARPVGVAAEVATIRAALMQLPGKVEMGVLAPARRDELLARLRRGYHVLHFVGHGAFRNGEGYLVLEDPDRKADPASASLIGQIVAGSSLRLAVLNACETAATGPRSAAGGLAHQMVRAGMTAVLAMQMSIAEPSASAFTREFYGALADGWPVEAAVQEGRRSIVAALGNAWHERVDWAIPALYLRASDGRILKEPL